MSNAPQDNTASNTNVCGAPSTRRGTERRAAILQAANTLFLEKGFKKVSLDDIVMLSGGSKAAIYQYFGNKSGLLAASFEYRCENFFKDKPFPEYEPGEPLYRYMLNLVTTIYAAFSHPDNLAFMRLVIEESQSDPVLAKLAYESGPKRGLNKVASVLARAHDAGEIICPQPYASATMFFGILKHIQWRLLVGLPALEDELSTDTYFPYLVERFLAGHATHHDNI